MKKIKLFLLTLIVMILSLVTVTTAQALEYATPDQDTGNTTLAQDQTINNNYLTAGNMVTIEGNVEGDLMAFGNQVEINGEVKGNIFSGASSVIINGKVTRDVFVGAGAVKIAKDAVVEGDLITGAGNINLLGEVKGSVYAGGANLNISGKVGKDVKASIGTLNLDDDASIAGDLIYTSDKEGKIKDKAQVAGKTERKELPEKAKEGIFAQKTIGAVLPLLTALLVGIVLLSLFPKKSTEIAQKINKEFWKSLGFGFLFLILLPIAILILLVIMIGLPLALILLALYIFAIYITKIFVGLCLGNWLSKGTWSAIWAMSLGVILLTIISLIPYLGPLAGLVIVLVGLGAIGTTILTAIRK